MARAVRVEHGGAFYHVMARGDRGERIFYDEADRVLFYQTLGEACERTAKELDSLPGSDVRKVALANLLLERTVARQSWIAEKLAMRSAANVSQQVHRYRAKRPRLTGAFKKYLQSVKI